MRLLVVVLGLSFFAAGVAGLGLSESAIRRTNHRRELRRLEREAANNNKQQSSDIDSNDEDEFVLEELPATKRHRHHRRDNSHNSRTIERVVRRVLEQMGSNDDNDDSSDSGEEEARVFVVKKPRHHKLRRNKRRVVIDEDSFSPVEDSEVAHKPVKSLKQQGVESLLQESEGGQQDLEQGDEDNDKGCSDNDDEINLNIAVSANDNAFVGTTTNTSGVVIVTDKNNNNSNNSNSNNSPNQPNPGIVRKSSSNNRQVSRDNNSDRNQEPSRKQAKRSGEGRRGVPSGSGSGSGIVNGNVQKGGGHVPSKFGDDCQVESVTSSCFTFSCKIPLFPFEVESWHGDNSCRFLLKQDASGQTQGFPKVRYFAPITPNGPFLPGDTIKHTFDKLSPLVKYYVGMVCENEFGKQAYVDRQTGRWFEVELEQGSCPSAPLEPVAGWESAAAEDSKRSVLVEWTIPEFGGGFLGATCTVGVSFNDSPYDAGNPAVTVTETTNRNQQTRITGLQEEGEYTFRVICSNSFCETPTGSKWSLVRNVCPTESPTLWQDQTNANPVVIHLLNTLEQPVRAARVSADGLEQSRILIEPNESLSQPSFVSHVWRVYTTQKNVLLSEFKVARAGMAVAIEGCVVLTDENTKPILPATPSTCNIEEEEKNFGLCRRPTSETQEACCTRNTLQSSNSTRTREKTANELECVGLRWKDVTSQQTTNKNKNSKRVGCGFDPCTSRCYSAQVLARSQAPPTAKTTTTAEEGDHGESGEVGGDGHEDEDGIDALGTDLERAVDVANKKRNDVAFLDHAIANWR